MSKYSFREVKRLEGQINREIVQFKNSNIDMPIEKTTIPELFSRMHKLDEPTWESLVIKHRDIAK